jgi:hypothetical protein
MLERIAWTLLVVAQAVNFDAGRVTATELERAFGDEPVSRPQRIRPLMVAKAGSDGVSSRSVALKYVARD